MDTSSKQENKILNDMDTSTKQENRRYLMIWIVTLNKRIEDT